MKEFKMTAEQYDEMTEQLLEQPCHVIDFLPRQVPENADGQFFAAERFYLEQPQVLGLYPRFANLLIQLNCYYDLVTGNGERWSFNLPPEELWARVAACEKEGKTFLNVLIPRENSLITLYAGDLYMTLYVPSEKLLELVTRLAAAQGLFVRAGEM